MRATNDELRVEGAVSLEHGCIMTHLVTACASEFQARVRGVVLLIGLLADFYLISNICLRSCVRSLISAASAPLLPMCQQIDSAGLTKPYKMLQAAALISLS